MMIVLYMKYVKIDVMFCKIEKEDYMNMFVLKNWDEKYVIICVKK